MCPEWTNDYTIFRDWSLNNGYQEGLEIDRENTNDNYEPSNCRWVTRKENTRKTRGIKLTLVMTNEIRELYATGNYTQQELADKYTISRRTINFIINNKQWR